MNGELSRHIGRFRLNVCSIEQEPTVIQNIMAGCIPVRAEMLYAENEIEYVALSNRWFRSVPHYEVIPEYVFILKDTVVVGVKELI